MNGLVVWLIDQLNGCKTHVFIDICADHRRILPKSFMKPDIYEHFSKDYLFLAAIKFINQVSDLN